MAVKRGKKQARRSGESSIPGYVWLLFGLLIGGAVMVAVYMKMPHAMDNLLPHPNPTAQPATAADSGVAPEGNPATATATAPVEPKKPKYDFYTLLPEKEVVIPDEELSAQVKAEAAAKLASQQQATLPVAPGATVNTLPNAATPVTPTVATNVAATQAASANATPAETAPASATPVSTTSPSTTSAAATTAATPKSGQYLLQAGAFRNNQQADDLKARIAMLGLIGRVEIVQTPAGEMHRVRLGPYATASELENAKQKLGSGGLPAVAIRVK